ncbi:MAG: type I-E CRISPR-associated protein Cas6/Cse3/CasE [Deltaproteobacteria bacterium]|nr:type I-E CRISPR-associated protein Cas6/Cse3/CasE [Deltaproteobacteria bacterium]
MYLSSLLINVGDNPDHPRPGRLWLRNLYHVHQRLCMAFPSDSRISEDPDFLKPFKPEEFGINQVHVKREADSGFLFRIDPLPGGRALILVQSALKPEWDYAFHNAVYLLAAPPEVKSFDLFFTRGQSLRFRLVANPTRRLSRHSLEADGQPVNKKWIGKRVPVPNNQLFDWLARRAEPAGFSVQKDCTNVQPGYIYFKKPDKRVDLLEDGQKTEQKEEQSRLRSVRYDGILQVTDPARIKEIIIRGIGPGKAYGLGLLSLAPP